MSTPTNPLITQSQPPGWEARKEDELWRSRRLATGLLIAVALIYLVTLLLEARYPWLRFVMRTAEAAMVGGIADWFAVTALFRHPLGLPIPHTAIVPRRKDELGETLGSFVQRNFLTEEVVVERLRGLHLGQRLATWLCSPANSGRVAEYVLLALGGALQVARDEEVQEFIERSIVARARDVPAAPLVGHVLQVALGDDRQKQLLRGLMSAVSHALHENSGAIRATISRSKPWWILVPIDDAVYQRLLTLTAKTVQSLDEDPDHPLYARFGELLTQLQHDLQHDESFIARGEALKDDLLEQRVVRDIAAAVWNDLKTTLLAWHASPDSPLRAPIGRGVERLGSTMADDAELRAKVEGWVIAAAQFVVRSYGDEAQRLIAGTVQRWNAEDASRRIELGVGKELQYIRVNGTIVGGLAGLVIALVSEVIPRL